MRDEKGAGLPAALVSLLEDLVRERRRDERRLRRPLPPLFRAYGRELRARGVGEKHRKDHLRLLERLLAAAGARRLRDWTTERIRTGLARGFPPGTRTYNYARSAAYGFSRFLEEGEMIPANPVRVIRRAKTKVILRRRPFSRDEFRRLIETVSRLSRRGRRRAAVYLAAVMSGYRKGELRALAPGDLRPDLIHLAANATKGGREGFVPIFPEVRSELLRLLSGSNRRRRRRLFHAVPKRETFQRDLVRAGIPRTTADGTLDFYSLRHSFGTALGLDLPERVCQEFMRHTDPRLTARYCHVALDEAKRALDRAPHLRAYLGGTGS